MQFKWVVVAIYDFQGTVLVVDDDPVIHMLLSEHLATLGCRAVLRADGADQALGYLLSDSANSINLIICDLQMPGKDGIEFLRDILEHAPHTNLAFVSASDRSILRAAESLARQRG